MSADPEGRSIIILAETNKYERDSGYRRRYFAKHKGVCGIYLCAYCGKPILRKNVTVDHIIPVYKAKTSWIYRTFVVSQKETGINSLNNLVAACSRCNQKKGKKTGLWVLRGIYGPFFWPIFYSSISICLAVFFAQNPNYLPTYENISKIFYIF